MTLSITKLSITIEKYCTQENDTQHDNTNKFLNAIYAQRHFTKHFSREIAREGSTSHKLMILETKTLDLSFILDVIMLSVIILCVLVPTGKVK